MSERQRVERIVGREDPTGPTVDVIVTTQGGSQTARAVRAGGGLVGIRSSANPPEGVPIDFLDWPFMLDNPSVERHLEMAEDLRPKYAVAPDIEEGMTLADAAEIGEQLRQFADHVIVVPKEVPVNDVPLRFIVGMPFRDEFDTDTGVNLFGDFVGRPTHILGGNSTDQLEVAGRFDLEVTSVDSPDLLKWANVGRVWVGRRGAATGVKTLLLELAQENTFDPERIDRRVESLAREAGTSPSRFLRDMPVEDYLDEFRNEIEPYLDQDVVMQTAFGEPPTWRQMLESRFYRIKNSVMNLRQAWQRGVVERPREVAPGRGPPPPAPEGLHGQGREEVLDRFLDAVMAEEIGHVDPPGAPEEQADFRQFGED